MGGGGGGGKEKQYFQRNFLPLYVLLCTTRLLGY